MAESTDAAPETPDAVESLRELEPEIDTAEPESNETQAVLVDPETEEEDEPNGPSRRLVAATAVSLAAALLTLAGFVAVETIEMNFRHWTTWRFAMMFQAVMPSAVLVFVFSLVSLVLYRRPSWSPFGWMELLSAALHGLILYSAVWVWIIYVGDAPFYNDPGYLCRSYSNPTTPDGKKQWEECLQIARIFYAAMWFTLAASGLFLISILVLLVIRCISWYKLYFRTLPTPDPSYAGSPSVSRWRFPTGQITLEFSVKVLRQEPTAPQPNNTAPAVDRNQD